MTHAEVVAFSGMCDASGAVPIDANQFLVASDEDNILRIYDVRRSGAPIAQIDLSSELQGPESMAWRRKKGRPLVRVPRPPRETDIEAATRLGDRAYFLASHSKAGGPRAARERYLLFATTMPTSAQTVELIGIPYRFLFEDLAASPSLSTIDWATATQTKPPSADALNIEAMSATPDGKLWIGLRSPQHNQKAVFVRIANPGELPNGSHARVDAVEFVSLNGLGARGLTHIAGQYLIAAGPAAKGRASSLFLWIPGTAPTLFDVRLPSDFNVEGFFNIPNSGRLMLLSDDGDRLIGGVECKKVADPRMRGFRGKWTQKPRKV